MHVKSINLTIWLYQMNKILQNRNYLKQLFIGFDDPFFFFPFVFPFLIIRIMAFSVALFSPSYSFHLILSSLLKYTQTKKRKYCPKKFSFDLLFIFEIIFKFIFRQKDYYDVSFFGLYFYLDSGFHFIIKSIPHDDRGLEVLCASK